MNAREFHFRGEISSSKSVFIRSLLMKVWRPDFEVDGFSSCQDVWAMRSAIRGISSAALASRRPPEPGAQPHELHCGEAGLVLRLMLACVSRFPGEYRLTGSPRLLQRPHDPLLKALHELGVQVWPEQGAFRVSTAGWRVPYRPLRVDRSISSQFASALILNAWDLSSPMTIEWTGDEVSAGYLEISLEMARALGMKIESRGHGVLILPEQKLQQARFRAEMDYSSAFAVAALAAVAGTAEILNPSLQTHQPDAAFLAILERMGVGVERSEACLKFSRAPQLLAVKEDLGACPDLFPVLGVLCALADGRSELRGAPHLRHKESDRIEKTAELVEKLGRQVVRFEDGLIISGASVTSRGCEAFELDPEEDHRLVMAGAVAGWAGLPVTVLKPEVVAKSYPEFLEVAQLRTGSPA